MTNVRVIKPALAALVAAAACVGGLAFSSAQPAQADTYSDLINAQNQHAASVQREAELKQQLAGASQDLANKVLELDDLTNNKIVAAQAKVTQANEDAATAQDEADAASGRLSAAQKDKETLEEQIKQTGKDYDDAHAAVAQLARDEMHGSNASDVMSVVTHQHTGLRQFHAVPGRVVPQRGECGFLRRDLTEHVEESWRALGGHRKADRCAQDPGR